MFYPHHAHHALENALERNIKTFSIKKKNLLPNKY